MARKKKITEEETAVEPEVADAVPMKPDEMRPHMAPFIAPEACADEMISEGQRVDIYLSAEYDHKDPDWREQNQDKAGYMNEQANRSRALTAIKA